MSDKLRVGVAAGVDEKGNGGVILFINEEEFHLGPETAMRMSLSLGEACRVLRSLGVEMDLSKLEALPFGQEFASRAARALGYVDGILRKKDE